MRSRPSAAWPAAAEVLSAALSVAQRPAPTGVLASAVAVPELVFRARMLVSETYQTNLIYLIVAVIYLVMSLPLARLSAFAERRLSASRRQ